LKDEFYNRHLLKNDVFGPILDMFKSTKEKYNLLNSACLEFFEFIKKVRRKVFVLGCVSPQRSIFLFFRKTWSHWWCI
jgi:protein phosphatase-4 regulatory subunit 3